MKHYQMDGHETSCKSHPDATPSENEHARLYDTHCGNNPQHFLFFMKNQFIILTYNICNSRHNHHLDFKENILNAVSTKSNVYGGDVIRGWDFNDAMKDYRLRGHALNCNVSEINYIYSDNANKGYCFHNHIPFDKVDPQKIENSYKEAKQYMEDNGFNYLLDQLEDLKGANHLSTKGVSDIEVYKTTEALLKDIKKQLK